MTAVAPEEGSLLASEAAELSADSGLAFVPVLWAPPQDTTAPLIASPGDLVVELGTRVSLGGGPAAPVSYSVSASDDCDGFPSLVCVPPSGNTFAWGTTTVTCTAQDAAGNVPVATFDVTVRPRLGGLDGPLR